MAFEVQRTKETVTIYGEAFEVRQPTVGDAIAMQKKAKTAGSEEVALEEMRQWAYTLVKPAERDKWAAAVDDMETTHFLSLVEYLAQGSKKKQDLIAGS